jgi:DNA-binding NarL/FixJ family response regulator
MPKIRVLIAEDHAVVRAGLKILISTEPDLEVAGEADDGVKAVRLARQVRPDIVLLDVAMPRSGGLDATRAIARELPGSKVLVLSAYADEDLAAKMLQAGAHGYLTKHSAADELLQAIRQVSRGGSFVSARLAARLRRREMESFLRGQKAAGTALGSLTRRETEVLRLVATGLATKQIAAQLSLSAKTVEKHRQAVMDKLDLHDRAGLTRFAMARGLLALAHDIGLREPPQKAVG